MNERLPRGPPEFPHQVLKGSFMFYSDLVRAIEPCPRGLTMDFIRASSYGSGTESTGDVKVCCAG